MVTDHWRVFLARSILPALAFSLDMFSKTGSNYGVNEVLLASVLGSVVFSVFAAQPLVIVGVTGVLSLGSLTCGRIRLVDPPSQVPSLSSTSASMVPAVFSLWACAC